MYKYKIRYKDDHDLPYTTKLYANSPEDATLKLTGAKEIIKITNLGKAMEAPLFIEKMFHINRLKPRELADILRHLSYTKSAGLSLIDSLMIMSSTGTIRQVTLCNKLLTSMQAGQSLAEAFEEHEYLLPLKISPIIKASSDSGTLETVLMSLAEQLEKSITMSNKIKTAMIYPVIVLIVAFAVTWFLFTTIIPQIADVITTIGDGQLPIMTSIILGIGSFLNTNWLIILLAILAIICITVFIVKRKAAIAQSRFALHAPLTGCIVRDSEMVKFYSHFAFLLQAGFTASAALDTAAQIVSNKYLRNCLDMAYKRVLQGYSISEALTMSNVTTTLESQIISIGETSGRLADVSVSISEQLANESDRRLQNLLRIMEPTVMLVIGAIVGVIMIAIYQPLFEMMTAI